LFGKKTEFGEGEKKSNLYNFANECPSTLIRVKKNKSRFQMGGIDKDMQISVMKDINAQHVMVDF
jgi:hypothetical protein